MKRAILTLVAFALLIPSGSWCKSLTYADLVNRLTDLEALAVLPEPGEKTAQWSSYDRRSRYDEKTGQYLDWDANLRSDRTGDGDGIIRHEDGGDVLAEMEGPGCIWRIWSADALSGHVRFYSDGAKEPAINLPFAGLFNRKNEPFTYSSLVYRTEAKGVNCYVPIPYKKSCKVVGEKGWGRYYHFTYSTFSKGTVVPTFKRNLEPEARAALQGVDGFFGGRLGRNPAESPKSGKTLRRKIMVAPGETAKVADSEGPLAISELKVKLLKNLPLEKASALLRETVLRITWDGAASPAVWAPLGDFFGTAPGVNYYRSLPMGETEEGFYSYWRMPFAKSALIELVNEGNASFSCEFTIATAPLTRPIEELGRFHAKWHRDAFLPTDPGRAPTEPRDAPNERLRAIDWTLLKTEGRGRFCGTMLHVWNPDGGWWGEGDEKFFVDGEKFPSTFGTGSEDYFGFAWCSPDLFQRAFHNQTFNGGRNTGHVSVNRWQIPDNVPFQKSFEGAIEKYSPLDRGKIEDKAHPRKPSGGAGGKAPRPARPRIYAAVAYWYLDAAGTDPYPAVPVSERTGYFDYIIRSLPEGKALVDADGFRVNMASKTAGRASVATQGVKKEQWRYLLWEGAMPGDSLELLLPPLEKPGKYAILGRFAQGPGFGLAQLRLDGKKLGRPVDLRAKALISSDEILLGEWALKAGPHRLTVEILGPGKAAAAFSIRSIRFAPAKATSR